MSDTPPPSAHASSPLFLLALLIGLAALGGTAYLVVSPRFTRRRSGESSALGALKSIANAQVLYREADKDGNGTLEYAPALSCLINTGQRRDEDLIDELLATGTKYGYAFRIEPSEDTRFVWAATASPIEPGVTGDRCFGINMAGQLFFSSTGPVRFTPDGSSTTPVLSR